MKNILVSKPFLVWWMLLAESIGLTAEPPLPPNYPGIIR